MAKFNFEQELFLLNFRRKPAKTYGFSFEKFKKENKIEDKFEDMDEEEQESYEKDYEQQKWN